MNSVILHKLHAALLMGTLLVPVLQAQEPVYHFTFEDAGLASSGLVKADAIPRSPRGREIAPEFAWEDEIGRWACALPMTPDGKQGMELVLPDSADTLRLNEVADALTISLWLRWEGPDQHGDRRQMIVSTLPVNQQTGWAFSVSEEGRLHFDWRPVDRAASSRESEAALVPGQWHFIALTWRNDVADSGLQFWIDGQSAGITRSFTGGGPLLSNTEEIVIGGTQGFLPLNGRIADVRIFAGALTADDLWQLFGKPSH